MKWPHVGMFFAVNNFPPNFFHPPRRPSCPSWPRRSRCKRTILRRFWSPVFERKKITKLSQSKGPEAFRKILGIKQFSKILGGFFGWKGEV